MSVGFKQSSARQSSLRSQVRSQVDLKFRVISGGGVSAAFTGAVYVKTGMPMGADFPGGISTDTLCRVCGKVGARARVTVMKGFRVAIYLRMILIGIVLSCQPVVSADPLTLIRPQMVPIRR